MYSFFYHVIKGIFILREIERESDDVRPMKNSDLRSKMAEQIDYTRQ